MKFIFLTKRNGAINRIKILCLFLLIFFTGKVGSCQYYFNNKYNACDTLAYDFSTTILPLGDGYISYGQCYLPARSNLTLMKVGLQGEKEWVKEFTEEGVLYGVGQPKSMIPTQDGQFALVGLIRTPYSGWVRDRGLIMKLSPDFDSIWTRTYGDQVEPCDSAYLFRQLKQDPDGDYTIVGGMMDRNAQLAQFYLLHTDSLGTKIWDGFYGTAPYQIEPYCVCQTSDNGYVLGGDQWIDELQTVDPVIYKTDSLGNEEWSKNLGVEYTDGMAIVGIAPDGNIIVGTTLGDSIIYPYHYYGKKYFTKMDNEGNVLWEHTFGSSYLDPWLMSMEVLEDGRIISTGYRRTFYPAVPEMVGWIFCITSDGDSLWYREYSLLDGENSENCLYDVTTANDNGFIACGYVRPAPPDTGTDDTWIIKVDSIGCESLENCWAGVDEKPEMVPPEPSVINVFPNPSNDKVFFEFSSGLKPEEMDLAVFNLMGVTVFHQPVHLSSGLFELDISSWPAGMYIARIVFMNEVAGTVKFVKE